MAAGWTGLVSARHGGLHSTLDDLYRWHLALESGTVLSGEPARKYQTGHVPSMDGQERYAYGWGVQQTRRSTRVVTHNGGNGFIFADFRRYVDENVVIIAMTNQGRIPAPRLAPREIEALVFNDGPTVLMPPIATDVPRDARDRLAGRYELSDGGTLTVRATTSGLEAEASDSMLFAATSLDPPGGRFAQLETRTMTLVNEAAKGNYRPIVEAFAMDRPSEIVEANQRKIWEGWRAELGAVRESAVLGTGIVNGDPAAVVRLRFAQGERIVEFIWGPRRLAGFRVRPQAGPVPLVAESPATWIFYSYRPPYRVALTFRDGGTVSVRRGEHVIEGRRP